MTVLSVFLALFSVSSTAEINQRVDRVVFSIHVDTAPQLDLNELEQHLEDAWLLFQESQQPSDDPGLRTSGGRQSARRVRGARASPPRCSGVPF